MCNWIQCCRLNITCPIWSNNLFELIGSYENVSGGKKEETLWYVFWTNFIYIFMNSCYKRFNYRRDSRTNLFSREKKWLCIIFKYKKCTKSLACWAVSVNIFVNSFYKHCSNKSLVRSPLWGCHPPPFEKLWIHHTFQDQFVSWTAWVPSCQVFPAIQVWRQHLPYHGPGFLQRSTSLTPVT